MNNLDVSGLLRTYSEKTRLAKTTEQLRDIVWELKKELDMRKINMEDKKDGK